MGLHGHGHSPVLREEVMGGCPPYGVQHTPRVPKVQVPGGWHLHLVACCCSTASPTSVVQRGSAGKPPAASGEGTFCLAVVT